MLLLPRWLLLLFLLCLLRPALAVAPALAPALLLLMLPLLLLLLLLLLVSLLLCSKGIWSLETLPLIQNRVSRAGMIFGRIRSNVFVLLGRCLIKGGSDC